MQTINIIFILITVLYIYLAYYLYQKMHNQCVNCETEVDYEEDDTQYVKDPYDPRGKIEVPGIKLRYLTKKQTGQFLIRDVDQYAASLTSSDLCARKVGSTSEYIRQSYVSARSFNMSQRNLIKRAIDEAHKFFCSSLGFGIDSEKMRVLPWTVALTDGNYEDGLPHTRADIIFLTPKILRSTFESLVGILIHEQVHIYQRTYSDDIHSYLSAQGYKVAFPRSQVARARANPDTDGMIYLDVNQEIHASIYTSDCPKRIQDIVTVPENNEAQEHPYETIAYSVASMYNGK